MDHVVDDVLGGRRRAPPRLRRPRAGKAWAVDRPRRGVLSFDDGVFLHERIAFTLTDTLGISDIYVQAVWPAVYFPLLLVVAVLLLQVAPGTPEAHRLIVLGLVVLASAVALEMAGVLLSWADVQPGSPARVVETVLEEGAETAGWILVATGTAARLLTLAQASRPPGHA